MWELGAGPSLLSRVPVRPGWAVEPGVFRAAVAGVGEAGWEPGAGPLGRGACGVTWASVSPTAWAESRGGEAVAAQLLPWPAVRREAVISVGAKCS